LPGYECRHNLVYWRYGDYIGIGPGAHGRLRLDDGRRLALSTERHPEAWRARVAAHGHGRVEELALAPGDQGLELLLMGLRLEEGIALANYEQLAGQRLDRSVVAGLMEQGLIRHDEACGRLATTAKGRKLLNSVIKVLASAADRPSIGY
jgi:oxygen-independent coproporphyrinogen-3 oxidase